MEGTPITAEHITRWTATGPILIQFVERGWPCDVPRECKSYTRRTGELSVQHVVLVWGARVIVPPNGRLPGKLSAGDAIAQEFKYHAARLAALYNRESAYKRDQYTKHESLCTKGAYPIAFYELVTYINEAKAACVDNEPLVIKAKHYAISSDTHQLQFIKLHHFKLERF